MPTLKEFWVQGKPTVKALNLVRQQAQNAITVYLMLGKTNKTTCGTCSHGKGQGPFVECVSAGDEFFHGACTNCQYSSGAVNCSLYKSKYPTTVNNLVLTSVY